MMTPRRRIEAGLFKRKVARRVFMLFILCALLPLGALALFSFIQVRGNLNTLSARRLQQATKSAGMTVIERLSFVDNDLRQIIAHVPSKAPGWWNSIQVDVDQRLADRFTGLTVVADGGRIGSNLFGSVGVLPTPTLEERRHLRTGGTLVTTARQPDNRFVVFVARLMDAANPDRGALFGEVNPDYLFGGDGFLTPPAELSVFGPAKEPLFSSLPDRTPQGLLDAVSTVQGPAGQFEWSHEGNRFVAHSWTLFMRPVFFNSWLIVQSERKSDVMAPLQSFATTFFLVVLLSFWVVTFLSFSQIRRGMVPVELLRQGTERIKNRDFSHRVRIKGNDEFAELGASFNDMTDSMENHVRVMSTMNAIGVSLSAEPDAARLLELILRGARTIFNSDGAALFLVSRDERLELCMLQIGSLGLLVDSSAAGTLHGLSCSQGSDAGAMWQAAGATQRTIVTPDVYSAGERLFAPQVELDRRIGYRSQSFLSTPLRNHENEVIGILQLFNAQVGPDRSTPAFSDEDQRLAESLASQAAVALTKNKLVADFKGLFDGLTELISRAIDEKSPYTGGHVRRVVELSMMIARAAGASANPALREFVASEDALYELRIAALLHDCGKITTPVHIQDKATKLETIWDRIALIDTRSEILRREHRAGLLQQAVLDLGDERGPQILMDIDRSSADFDHQLEQDLAFLRTWNSGSEHMPESARARVRAIARKYGWLSADHRTESLITADELRHLTIASGTLSPEERDTIDNHVTSTIRMLEELPYPKKLRNIPLAAGSHHERMDGKGYPRGLAGDQIPIAGRIIGIADIFEALTATDRPYKKPNSLPEALRILKNMVESGHIDPDLYDVFMNEKIYLRYAEAHPKMAGRLDAGGDDVLSAAAEA